MLLAPAAPKSKLSLFLETTIRSVLDEDAAAYRRDASEHAERILIEYLINMGLIDPIAAYRKRVFWFLIEFAVYEAQELCRAGKRSRTITRDAIQACTRDPVWAAHYYFYVGDNIFKNGNEKKGDINRELGWQIKRAVGGEVEKDANGKTANEKVLGEVIQSFTPLTFADDAELPQEASERPMPPPLPEDAFGTKIDPLNPPDPHDRFYAQPGDIQFVKIADRLNDTTLTRED